MDSTGMVSILELAVGAAVFIVVTVLIEEVISYVIRRAAKAAGTSPTVIRDVVLTMRVIAIVIIVAGILRLTGLASDFTTLTISGIGALAVSLALQNTLSNVISGIFLFYDGVIHLNDTVEFGSVKGKVVRLGLRNTWIKMDSGEIAVISNSQLAGGPLINHSATERLSEKYAIE
jgi:small conductance mechanosensitive channel